MNAAYCTASAQTPILSFAVLQTVHAVSINVLFTLSLNLFCEGE